MTEEQPTYDGDVTDNKIKEDDRTARQIKERANYLASKNSETINRLAKQGVRISAEELTPQRLEVLINHLLGGEDSMGRVTFEERWQEHLKKGLDNTEAKVEEQKNKKRLHVPGRGGS